MKRVLVAINYSEQSPTIIKYALKLAQYLSVELDFVYVQPNFKIGEEKGKFINNVRAEHKISAEDKLLDYVGSFYDKQYHDIDFKTHVALGHVNEELPLLALELKSDLLIVGKHFQNRFSIFGDTAESLISTCACPVMTIPKNVFFRSIKRIIYASTFLLEDCAAIFELQEWLKAFKGELICINVSKTESELPRAKIKMSILERLFPQDNISFRCFVSDENLAVQRFSDLNEGDVLCNMHKDRSMFQWLFNSDESIDFTRHSEIPMVVFHQHMLSLAN